MSFSSFLAEKFKTTSSRRNSEEEIPKDLNERGRRRQGPHDNILLVINTGCPNKTLVQESRVLIWTNPMDWSNFC